MTTFSGSTVAIDYTAPGGTASGITNHVLFGDAYFESQLAAIPGQFQMTVKDEDQTLDFVTGGEITLSIDGSKYYGGFITQVSRTFAVPADDTVSQAVSAVKTRQWKLAGVDYNVLLDKRILRNTSDYTHIIPSITTSTQDGDIIKNDFGTYFDLSGLDVATKVTNVNTFAGGWTWPTQGSTMRQVLDALVIQSTLSGSTYATLYYVDAAKDLNYLALQTATAPFGFSDNAPDGTTFIGFRDGTATEDGSSIANDVFVWGGSPWASGGGIVLGRATNSTSVSAHGRWQLAESDFGQPGLGIQAGVTARANALVSGATTGTSPVTGAQGLVNPDLQFTLTWFAHDVPTTSGVRNHLLPGFVTTLDLWTFSTDGGATPFTYDVPARQIQVTFPSLKEDGTSYVQFTGTFGIQLSDPVWLWQYLLRKRTNSGVTLVAASNPGSTAPPYGSLFQGAPTESPDGSRTTFSIPFAYISGTTQVYLNGLDQLLATSYTESAPASGQITFTFAPVSADTIWIVCRTAA